MTQQDALQDRAKDQPLYASHLGMKLISASPERVEIHMPVTEALTNRNGVLHGGAIMSLADNAGGTATFMNLPADKSTTTIESKTNFLRPIRLGEIARAVTEPIHRGRTTMVFQTQVSRDDGKVAAIVTQTQMVIDWRS